MQKAYLILENGTIFEGQSFGASGEAIGEIVFTTSMTGYVETLTDPSYYGQIVVQTFPLIGNYGVMSEDVQSSKVQVKAYIVREWCQEPSNFRCEGDLDTFLKSAGIPALYDIDTRALTRIVREYGVMNCRLTYSLDNLESVVEEIKPYKVEKAVSSTSTENRQFYEAENPERSVVLIDYGAKHNIGRELVKRGCNLTVVPYNTTAEEILSLNPDGIMLSNGPGDPQENVEAIETLKKLCEKKIPTFGICLGHQLLALSQGAKTEKLHYGHRGANQPAKEIKTDKVYITSQNHGYAVINDSVPENAEVSFVNGNDGTCEGITYTDMPAFSVQFHPEACGGPKDTAFLFDRFINMIDENK